MSETIIPVLNSNENGTDITALNLCVESRFLISKYSNDTLNVGGRSCIRYSKKEALLTIGTSDGYNEWQVFSLSSDGAALTAVTSYGGSNSKSYTSSSGKTLYHSYMASAYPTSSAGYGTIKINGSTYTIVPLLTLSSNTLSQANVDLITDLLERLKS